MKPLLARTGLKGSFFYVLTRCRTPMGPLKIVVEKAELGHLLIFSARPAIIGIGIDADSATRGEYACHLNILWVHQADKVLHNLIHTILMEIAMIAERKEIELQALALDHTLIGQVADANLGKIRLARYGAQTCKLGAVEAHPIVVLGMFVLK